jgi:hypothetical protein
VSIARFADESLLVDVALPSVKGPLRTHVPLPFFRLCLVGLTISLLETHHGLRALNFRQM